MTTFNEQLPSLFIPTINILQENGFERRFNFEIDFQNNDLYNLQEMTRCSALLNYINKNGRQMFKSNINNVFDTYIQIQDPLAVFVDNFEQFFAMYIHSKYGKNNFKIYMKECEKSPVAYPISVFADGMCIFMQFNKNELRRYIYTMMTMFYYYTGQSFYDMIRSQHRQYPVPNTFDDFDNINTPVTTSTRAKKRNLGREEKLCILNNRNYNINKPYVTQQNSSRIDTLSQNSHFEKCVLTTDFSSIPRYPEILLREDKQKQILGYDQLKQMNESKFYDNLVCNKNGITNNSKFFQYSNHLQRSLNFESNTLNDITNEETQSYENQAQIQTNFSRIWICNNRQQLISLAVINDIMNICIQKITFSLLEIKNCKGRNTNMDDCEQIFTCINNKNTVNYATTTATTNDRGRDIKIKKPTIEISFNKESSSKSYKNPADNSSCIIDFMQFST